MLFVILTVFGWSCNSILWINQLGATGKGFVLKKIFLKLAFYFWVLAMVR